MAFGAYDIKLFFWWRGGSYTRSFVYAEVRIRGGSYTVYKLVY